MKSILIGTLFLLTLHLAHSGHALADQCTQNCRSWYGYGSNNANACAAGVLGFWNGVNTAIGKWGRPQTRNEYRAYLNYAYRYCRAHEFGRYQGVFNQGCWCAYNSEWQDEL